ncbi:mediator of RNA polymerase II transcription subunit 22-like isoform X1 [Rhopilema esculentum]|uniref:mediator of RNA polymerase II transcription subunit 22-like isoform X1 n=1 Tax=Rhopilema esculentum TaxID=499914 RepID=UPI0031E0402B|eukprot:gene11026-19871_t
MSQPQKGASNREALLKSYNRRLKDDVRSILENFNEIVKSAKIEEETQIARLTEAVQTQYEIEVRASNIVRAGESLLKLVSDMKEFLILNDFLPVNSSISKVSQRLKTLEGETETKLCEIKESFSTGLAEMEKEYALMDNRCK